MSALTRPRIRKARRVVGDTLVFRDATQNDAAFILSLRTDAQKSRYLHSTSPDLQAQRAWMERYAAMSGEAYFIIEHRGEAIGTVRLYDAQRDSFCWGSWILADSRPHQAAMESALMVYAYAIDHLGFHACHFDVRKANAKVIAFHERFGAKIVGETQQDYLFALNLASIVESRKKYTQFLSAGVTVEWLQ